MKAQTQRRVRQIHLYLGVFFAPAIIFFAVSGALQTFRLQEEKGWGGTPPEWIVWLAAIHKDQAPPRPKPAEAGPPREGASATAEKPRPRPPAPARKSKLPMQVFTVVMSVGLILSALLGIVIALNNRTLRRGSLVMLLLGLLVPILLI